MRKRKGIWSNWNGIERFTQGKWEKHAAKFGQEEVEMIGHKELQTFRIRLLKELETLEHPHRLVEIPTLEDGIQDILDRAHAEREKSLFFHLQEREGCSIEKIFQALKRIEEGTFGICEDCKGRIPRQRLQANPSATLCVQCQGIRERQGRRNISNGRRSFQLL